MASILATAVFATSALVLAGCGGTSQATEEDEVPDVAVQVATVHRATLHEWVEAYGEVQAEPAGGGRPAGSASLAAPAAGIVMSVPVREGERVAAGTVIVKLDDHMALAETERARHTVEFAQQQLDRQDTLLTIGGTSRKAAEEAGQRLAEARADLATAKASLALVQLATPLSGTVASISARPGQAVDANTVLAEIVDLDRLVVVANVPAGEAAQVRVGQIAEIGTDETGAPAMTSQVAFVGPSVDDKTGAVQVRVAIARPSGLRPGQFVRVRIASAEHADRLVVPRASVVTDPAGQSFLAVVHGDQAVERSVRTGLRDGDRIEVEGSSLAEGDTVVTVGAYGLPKVTRIRVVKP